LEPNLTLKDLAGSIPAISYKNNSVEKVRTIFSGDYSPSQGLRTKLELAQQVQTADWQHCQAAVCFFCNMLFCNQFSITQGNHQTKIRGKSRENQYFAMRHPNPTPPKHNTEKQRTSI